ncbi:alpha/beta fold hydrolase [Luteimonas terrae]|uniref:Pimeloyl-ACP methyl ester carboxylesterase n=1 Tax=Luteimonas terrae TaxID=1530191 RepID=A0ABU1XTM0_9GAMM|nr:alpha/beta hydrolase [Luteimonas terrae]MDR7191511.1 pimeloyl-ACP methyl ester carboxylesterase [Luteimonas terrae]
MIRIAPYLLSLAALSATSVSASPYGGELQGFDYPHPRQAHAFDSQGQALSMAYMDVRPEGAGNGRTAVLLHGKNFCGPTWDDTITVLVEAGWRVIAPDQIGFCGSTKPRGYQFSFAQLAANTQGLLEALGVERAVLIGHSMGGMLATRYALQYPDAVEQLVLVNPIGLEDWQAEGVPYASIDTMAEGERKTTFDSIKAYQLKFYYDGQWAPRYDRWVDMLAGMYAGPDREIVAWNQAQTSEMVFTQPVVHEFPALRVPTLLMIGGKDRTAPGANRAPEVVAARLGDYPALGRKAAESIPDAQLIEFPALGHSPQVEAPDEFHAALLRGLVPR